MSSSKAFVDVPVEPGKVVGVRNQFLLHGDEGLAHQLQSEEFNELFSRNRSERQVARTDVPLAKVVQTEEDDILQREALERLELLKQRTEEDAMYAKQMMREELLQQNDGGGAENEDDIKLAKQIQTEELHQVPSTEDDARIARELQREELQTRKRERVKREDEDKSYAEKLQERERRLGELMRVERRLRKQHRLQQQKDDVSRTADGENFTRPTPTDISESPAARGGFELELDDDDRQLRQDMEMARALQELEMEQRRVTQVFDDDEVFYDVEKSDARVARIMQEQERLDALLRREQRRVRRAATERAQTRTASSANRSPAEMQLSRHRSEDDSLGPRPPPPYERRHPENQYNYPVDSRRTTNDERSEIQCEARGGRDERSRLPPVASRPQRPPAPQLPPDFLRLQDDSVDDRRNQRHAEDRGRNTAPGPLYIGPLGRTTSFSTTSGSGDRRVLDRSRVPASAGIQRSESKSGCKQQ